MKRNHTITFRANPNTCKLLKELSSLTTLSQADLIESFTLSGYILIKSEMAKNNSEKSIDLKELLTKKVS